MAKTRKATVRAATRATKPAPKPRPKTGEPRETKQPLKIDRLPESVHDAILGLRNGLGLTWMQIEERSAKPYSKEWAKDKGGFVDWDNLPTDTLELFPQLRLPHSNLHRWYDLRIAQVRDEVIEDGDAAQKFVEKLGALQIDGMNDAVQNAMVREVFGMVRSVGAGDRLGMADALNKVSLVLARLQRVKLQQDQINVEQRKLKIVEAREEAMRRKLDAETEKLTKKASKGEALTIADINKIRSTVFGMKPLEVARA